jgi:hypothetical protein
MIFKTELNHPTNKNMIVIFEAYEEDLSIEKSFDCKETVDYIYKELKSGNQSAWFSAHIVVKFKGIDELEGDYWLGGCSYPSFQQFIDDKGYFDDMILSATNDLLDKKDKLEKKLIQLSA